MEIFQVLRKKLTILNISPTGSNSFNWKIAMCFLMLGYSIFSNIIFIRITENIVLLDYVKVFCIVTELTKMGLCLATIALRQMKLFEILGNIESLINKSKFFCQFG